MEMSIVNLVGTSVDGARVSLLPTTLGAALRPRAFRAVTGDALGGRGYRLGAFGIKPSLTSDPTLDVTPEPTS